MLRTKLCSITAYKSTCLPLLHVSSQWSAHHEQPTYSNSLTREERNALKATIAQLSFRFAPHPSSRPAPIASNLAAGPWCSRVSTLARNALTPPGAPHTSISPSSRLFSALVRLPCFTPALANVRLLWQFVLQGRVA